MSYDIYVNEKYIDQIAIAGEWSDFIDWTDTLPTKDYEELVRLSEHSFTDQVATIEAQAKAALKIKKLPSGIRPILKRIIDAAGKLDDDEAESILWVTDGVDGMIEAIIGENDLDHASPGDADES